MRFSPDGKYALNSDTLGVNAMDAWWLNTETVITYRYDPPWAVAAYTCQFQTLTWKVLDWMDKDNPNNPQAAHRLWVRAMGTNEWAVEFADDATFPGTFDSAHGFWPHGGYGLIAMGDQGERVFIGKPDFARILISHNGVEQTVPAPNWGSGTTTLRQGHLMWDSTSGPRDINGTLVGPPGAMQTFHIGPDGQKWCTGYVGGWGLSVWKWGTTRGYNLSRDDHDFYPDIFVSSPTHLRVGSSETQGDTRLRLYEVDLATMVYTSPTGIHPLVELDLSIPPADTTPFTAWEGPFFASSNRYGSATTPGNCEVLLQGTYDLLEVKRPVLAGVGEAASVPDSQLIGIFWQADPATYAQALAYAKHRKRPLYVYSDTNVYPDEVLQKYCTWSGAIPLVQAYPADKKSGEPLKASPAEDVARISAQFQKLKDRGFKRLGIVRTMYTQSGNYPLDHILAMQDGLTSAVLTYGVGLDVWFSWLRDPANSAGGIPALQVVAQNLSGRATAPAIQDEAVPVDPPIVVPPIVVPPVVVPPVVVPPVVVPLVKDTSTLFFLKGR